ncbi:methionine/alanine import family NSS transporter small subunit [Streptomyces harbinensis]
MVIVWGGMIGAIIKLTRHPDTPED